MFSKQFITIPRSKDLFFRVHSHAFNSFIFTLLCENRKRSLILSDAVAKITELREAELLDSLILINVVSGITELRVENSQKINCCGATSIREGRVISSIHIGTLKIQQIFEFHELNDLAHF